MTGQEQHRGEACCPRFPGLFRGVFCSDSSAGKFNQSSRERDLIERFRLVVFRVYIGPTRITAEDTRRRTKRYFSLRKGASCCCVSGEYWNLESHFNPIGLGNLFRLAVDFQIMILGLDRNVLLEWLIDFFSGDTIEINCIVWRLLHVIGYRTSKVIFTFWLSMRL